MLQEGQVVLIKLPGTGSYVNDAADSRADTVTAMSRMLHGLLMVAARTGNGLQRPVRLFLDDAGPLMPAAVDTIEQGGRLGISTVVVAGHPQNMDTRVLHRVLAASQSVVSFRLSWGGDQVGRRLQSGRLSAMDQGLRYELDTLPNYVAHVNSLVPTADDSVEPSGVYEVQASSLSDEHLVQGVRDGDVSSVPGRRDPEDVAAAVRGWILDQIESEEERSKPGLESTSREDLQSFDSWTSEDPLDEGDA